MELLRLLTCGSIDDGKSTLIGRLLYDNNAVHLDFLESIKSATKGKLETKKKLSLDFSPDLSLITDGLKAEREQGITIDVAYKYFSTSKRKFIIADTPGHIEYTRNMITGASTSQLTVILLDAAKGVKEQTRRHSYISSFLNIQHAIFAINKMDLIDYNKEKYLLIANELDQIAKNLNFRDYKIIPISALNGVNVVEQKEKKMKWYEGPTLSEYLNTVQIRDDYNLKLSYFTVQYIAKNPNKEKGGEKEKRSPRTYLGNVSSGIFQSGDKVVVTPSLQKSKIKKIYIGDKEIKKAFPPMSIGIELTDEIDIERGTIITKQSTPPKAFKTIIADICWLQKEALHTNKKFIFTHANKEILCSVKDLLHKINIHTFEEEDFDLSNQTLELNALARVRLILQKEIYASDYRVNRNLGSFILIDPVTNATAAAGMIHIP